MKCTEERKALAEELNELLAARAELDKEYYYVSMETFFCLPCRVFYGHPLLSFAGDNAGQ